MESRNVIREKHGIDNARRISMASKENSDVQSVTVTDGHGEVILNLGQCSYPAGLTPQQARLVARQLIESAKRVGPPASKGTTVSSPAASKGTPVPGKET